MSIAILSRRSGPPHCGSTVDAMPHRCNATQKLTQKPSHLTARKMAKSKCGKSWLGMIDQPFLSNKSALPKNSSSLHSWCCLCWLWKCSCNCIDNQVAFAFELILQPEKTDVCHFRATSCHFTFLCKMTPHPKMQQLHGPLCPIFFLSFFHWVTHNESQNDRWDIGNNHQWHH